VQELRETLYSVKVYPSIQTQCDECLDQQVVLCEGILKKSMRGTDGSGLCVTAEDRYAHVLGGIKLWETKISGSPHKEQQRTRTSYELGLSRHRLHSNLLPSAEMKARALEKVWGVCNNRQMRLFQNCELALPARRAGQHQLRHRHLAVSDCRSTQMITWTPFKFGADLLVIPVYLFQKYFTSEFVIIM